MTGAEIFQITGLACLLLGVLGLRSHVKKPNKTRLILAAGLSGLGLVLVIVGLSSIRLAPLGPILPGS